MEEQYIWPSRHPVKPPHEKERQEGGVAENHRIHGKVRLYDVIKKMSDVWEDDEDDDFTSGETP